jgi:hypothetical protein
MFALYYEQDDGRLVWIASCQDVRSARNVAQIYSTGHEWPVVCIYNDNQGATSRCCLYNNGQEIVTGFPFAAPDDTQSTARSPDQN